MKDRGKGHDGKRYVGDVVKKGTKGFIFNFLSNQRQGKNTDQVRDSRHARDVNINVHASTSFFSEARASSLMGKRMAAIIEIITVRRITRMPSESLEITGR